MGETNFKTKPNHDVDPELKTKIKTVFHHLTKRNGKTINYLLPKQKEPVEKTYKKTKNEK
jgi:ATP-dependent RNA helicase DeaD